MSLGLMGQNEGLACTGFHTIYSTNPLETSWVLQEPGTGESWFCSTGIQHAPCQEARSNRQTSVQTEQALERCSEEDLCQEGVSTQGDTLRHTTARLNDRSSLFCLTGSDILFIPSVFGAKPGWKTCQGSPGLCAGLCSIWIQSLRHHSFPP